MKPGIYFDGYSYQVPVYPVAYYEFLDRNPLYAKLKTSQESVNGLSVLFVTAPDERIAKLIWKSVGHTKYVEALQKSNA